MKEIPIVFWERERGESKVRFAMLVTYLFRLVVLLARRMGTRLRPFRSPSLPQGQKVSKIEN